MRCSSCEPLLDAYLEATLRRRLAREVAGHLRDCGDCDSLLQELRVIDALLTTASPPGSVGGDFTASVLSAARSTRTRSPRRVGFLVPLFIYLAAAWAAIAFLALRSDYLVRFAQALTFLVQRNLQALGAAVGALAPATPLAAAAVTVVLLLDLFLLGALFFGYRRLRPLLTLYLGRGSRS